MKQPERIHTNSPKLIVGMFFADDAVSCQHAYAESLENWKHEPHLGSDALRLKGSDTLPGVLRVNMGATIQETCRDVAKKLKERIAPTNIAVLSIATPGPIMPPVHDFRRLQSIIERGTKIDRNNRPIWDNQNIAKEIADALGLPIEQNVVWQLDVEALATGDFAHRITQKATTHDEMRPQAERRIPLRELWAKHPYVFVVADEGINATIIANGSPLRGRNHSELGHVIIQRHPQDKHGEGSCTRHTFDCLEGVASLAAIRERWKINPERFVKSPKSELAVHLTSFYLAQLVCNLIMTTSPRHIVLGGRIVENPHVITLVREWTKNLLSPKTQYENSKRLYPGYDEAQDPKSLIQKLEARNHGLYGCLIAGQRSAFPDIPVLPR
jgi:predicted NBD/HSP70 family sugar kinase